MLGYAPHRLSEGLTVNIVPLLVNIDEVSPARVCTSASDRSNDFLRKHKFQ
jgi:hypothetical protein